MDKEGPEELWKLCPGSGCSAHCIVSHLTPEPTPAQCWSSLTVLHRLAHPSTPQQAFAEPVTAGTQRTVFRHLR